MKTAVIWTTPTCHYCKLAKQLLLDKDYAYVEKVIGKGYTRKEFNTDVPGATTVPQIFIGDVHIGGYEELTKRI